MTRTCVVAVGLALSGLLLAPAVGRATEALVAEGPPAAVRPLVEFVRQPDASFGWVERQEGRIGAARFVELVLTSQTWRGIGWKHQLVILVPSAVAPDNRHALLFISGGSWSDELEQPGAGRLPSEVSLLAPLAEQLGTPIAVLRHVPHQPILGGRYEDQIIAYTFQQFLRTDDATWPLLLPMVNSAVRAMDAVQAVAGEKWSLEIEAFTVTGASKRGWTTWLTAAVDRRVAAIAPMVIDVLNIRPQMEHQRATWGEFSTQIGDYTELRLQDQLDTPGGRRLLSIVDPYDYREDLTLPKLIILGTNDAYWPLDALNLYWDGLPGEKYVLYVPNNGHGLRDYERLIGSLAALHERALGRRTLPQLGWQFERLGERLRLEVQSDAPPREVRVWLAAADTLDFRQATWRSEPMRREGSAWVYELAVPESGYAAVLGEAVYAGGPLPLFLSTNVRIVGGDRP